MSMGPIVLCASREDEDDQKTVDLEWAEPSCQRTYPPP